MVDKCSLKILCFTKDTVIKFLTSLVVQTSEDHKRKGFFMWGVLLPMPVDCETASSRDVIRIDIFRTLYEDTRGQYQYMRFVVRSSGITWLHIYTKSGRYSVLPLTNSPVCLDIEIHKMPLNVTGRRPTY